MTKNPFVNALAVITAILLLAAWAVYALRGGSESTSQGIADATFTISGKPVTLVGGSADTVALFGEPLSADIDSDGDEDLASYLTVDSGGSGTFFYVVVALKERGGYRGTNAMFLGDRIAPQNINFKDGRAVANFAERKPGEPFTARE